MYKFTVIGMIDRIVAGCDKWIPFLSLFNTILQKTDRAKKNHNY